MKIRCPHCQSPIEVVEDCDYKSLDCPSCGSNFSLVDDRATETHRSEKRTIAQYELLDKLGMGAFGSVWKAKDTTLDRIVALKIPRKEQLDESDLEMFFREARAAAQLKHPSIVSVHEVGRDGNQVFIASDFIDGVTLTSKLTYERPTVDEAVTLIAKIADAVEAAHDAGVIHRDLKPSNVIIDKDGEPHVMDFGLAKRESGEITMTMEGARLGTPAYMPPEQLGKAHEADARSDVYSLGVMLFELLTGELPFRGDQAALLHQLANDEPPSPRKYKLSLSRDLETICLRCMEKDPSKRPESAKFLAEELRRHSNGKPIELRPISKIERASKWCRRNPSSVRWASAVTVLMVLAISVTWFVRTRTYAAGLVDGLATADEVSLREKLDEVERYGWWTRSMIDSRFENAKRDNEKINLGLALLRTNDSELELLTEELLTCDIRRFAVLRDELEAYNDLFLERFWTIFRDDRDKRRLHAGLAIAKYAANAENWTQEDGEFLAKTLLEKNPEDQPLYRGLLVDIKERLYPELHRALVDSAGRERRRLGAAMAFEDYAASDIKRLAQLLTVSTPEQFTVLYPLVAQDASPHTLDDLGKIASTLPPDDMGSAERVSFGQRRANAAITLLRLGERERVLSVFDLNDDPEALNQFIFRCRPRGVAVESLLDCLEIVSQQRSCPRTGW